MICPNTGAECAVAEGIVKAIDYFNVDCTDESRVDEAAAIAMVAVRCAAEQDTNQVLIDEGLESVHSCPIAFSAIVEEAL